jgi:glycogen(starch) synthase
MDPRVVGVTIVAFIIYPAQTNSFNAESLRGQAVAKHMRDTVTKIKDNIGQRMYEACLRCGQHVTLCA